MRPPSVLTRCNFNTLSLTSKKFFSGGSRGGGGGGGVVVVVVVIWQKTLKFVYGEAASVVGGLKWPRLSSGPRSTHHICIPCSSVTLRLV